MQKKIIKSLITILFIVLLLDPTDRIFHLKMPLFLMIILVWITSKINSRIRYKSDAILMIIVLISIALFGILLAVLQNDDVDYVFAAGFIKSLTFLFLLIIIIDLDIQPDMLLNKFAIILPLVIIPFYIVVIYYPVVMGIAYGYLVVDKEVAMISNRNFYGYEIVMVYYKTSAMLVFPLSFYCNRVIIKKNVFRAILCVMLFYTSLIMSGTRANIVAATIIILYYIYIYLKKKKNIIYSIIALTAVFICIISFALSLSYDNADQSSDIKSGHLVSFINNMKDNPEYLIWGQGLGSKSFTSGKNEFVAQTELTYFDLIRFFGIPLAVIFLLMIIYPIIYLYNNKMINETNTYAIVAYLNYLFISGTNPLLISSTGMVILIIMYSFTNKRVYNSNINLCQGALN